MKNRLAVALAAATAALLFTGCGGGHQSQSYVPGTSSFGNFSWTSRNGMGPAATLPPCLGKPAKTPGKYTAIGAVGSFSGTSFSGAGFSMWGTFTILKGTNHLPTVAPKLGASYTIYYGTYKLSSGFLGCFYLAKASYKGVSFNGAAAGWPNLRNYGLATPNAQGPLAIDLKGISGKGGSGTLTLRNPAGKTVATGTVSIVGSKIIK